MTAYVYRPDHPAADEQGMVAKHLAGPIETGKGGPYFVPDIKPFQSPLDYSEISSRSALREHERRYGVRQAGELKTPQDFDTSHLRQERYNERALERAFGQAVQKVGI